jgi:hypothetical protein
LTLETFEYVLEEGVGWLALVCDGVRLAQIKTSIFVRGIFHTFWDGIQIIDSVIKDFTNHSIRAGNIDVSDVDWRGVTLLSGISDVTHGVLLISRDLVSSISVSRLSSVQQKCWNGQDRENQKEHSKLEHSVEISVDTKAVSQNGISFNIGISLFVIEECLSVAAFWLLRGTFSRPVFDAAAAPGESYAQGSVSNRVHLFFDQAHHVVNLLLIERWVDVFLLFT